MTMHNPPGAALAAAEHSAYGHGYERMRRHAVEPGAGHDRHGLAVGWRCAASRPWLDAFAELPTPPAAVCSPASPGPLPTGVETSAIDILIAMLEGSYGEGRRMNPAHQKVSGEPSRAAMPTCMCVSPPRARCSTMARARAASTRCATGRWRWAGRPSASS